MKKCSRRFNHKKKLDINSIKVTLDYFPKNFIDDCHIINIHKNIPKNLLEDCSRRSLQKNRIEESLEISKHL